MRFLHLADLHLGKTVNGFPMLEDQRFILGSILDTLKARNAAARDSRETDEGGIDAVVLAGDLYDKAAPSAEAMALLDWFLTGLADAGIPCLAVSGNHDSAGRVAYAGELMRSRDIFVSPVYDGHIESWTCHDEFGPVTFWLMPFLKPLDVRHAFPEQAEEIGQDYTAAVRIALGQCEIDAAQRNVLIAHQFVTYGAEEVARSDSELFVGGLDNVDGHIFDRFDYVALGHIHRPQRIGREEMRYAGSLLKYSYSEARYGKTAPIVELGPKGSVHTTLMPLRPLHDLREIVGTVGEIAAAAENDPDTHDYIHAILTDDLPKPSDRLRLREAYPNLMGFEYRRQKDSGSAKSPGGAPDRPPIETLSPSESFLRFYAQANGHPPTAAQEELVVQLMDRITEGEGDERNASPHGSEERA